MNIAYFANPASIHDTKWINHFARDHSVLVICGKASRREASRLDPGVRVEPLLPPYSIIQAWRTRRTTRLIKKLCDDFAPDIVHSMYAVPNALWGDSVARHNHVITTRGSDLLLDYSKTLQSPRTLAQQISYPIMRKRLASSVARAAFVTSTSARQQAIVAAIRESKEDTHVVRTGVDPTIFACTPKARHKGAFVLFSPRSMKPIYNIEAIVRAVATVSCVGRHNVKLRLIDDQPGSEYSIGLRTVIRTEKVSELVQILPELTQTDMLLNYEAADAVIMVPRSDGTPVSAVEAMLMRRPVILGGLDYDPDLFNASTVWLTPDLSRRAVSATIAAAIENETERETRVECAYEAALLNANLQKGLETVSRIYAKVTGRGGVPHSSR